MKTLPVAVQVYSVRDDAERDFKGTMQKIKDMGYDGVELAGLYGMKPAEVKAILEEVGLVPLSAHVPFQELEADIEGTVAQYKEIGMQYIAIPYLMKIMAFRMKNWIGGFQVQSSVLTEICCEGKKFIRCPAGKNRK